MNVIEKGKLKAKRKIKALNFTGENSAIALVSKEQGGPANSVETLVVKSQNISLEYLEKMQAVKVTMSTPEFLERFFGLWYDQAEVLAAMMGYKEEVETPEMEVKEWVQERLQAFEIIKSLHEAPDLDQALAGLNETQYLSLLTDQFLIEKALKELDKKKESELVAKASESDNSTHASVEKSVEVSTSEKTKSKEKHMTKPATQETTVEMVEKSALVALQKSLEDNAVELQKALDSIAVFKQEKQELINKSKTAQFTAVIKDEKLSAPIVKAALALESQEDFDALLGAVTEMQAEITKQKEAVEKSGLFTEQGATVTEDAKDKESAVARILKSKQAK